MANLADLMGKITGKSKLDIGKIEKQVAGEPVEEVKGQKGEQPQASVSREVVKPPQAEKIGIQPIGRKIGEKKPQAVELSGKKGKKDGIKKILIIFVAVLVLLVISLSASKVVPVLKRSKDATEVEEKEPTPTPQTFDTYKSSVYANDSEVLKLEEDISIFEREVSAKDLRYSELFPPTLDFNIKF